MLHQSVHCQVAQSICTAQTLFYRPASLFFPAVFRKKKKSEAEIQVCSQDQDFPNPTNLETEAPSQQQKALCSTTTKIELTISFSGLINHHILELILCNQINELSHKEKNLP